MTASSGAAESTGSVRSRSRPNELAKTLLYYAFTPLADPEAIRLWQRDLCRGLGLRGRIIVSPQGINGTVGGPMPAVKHYLRSTREYPGFHGLDAKWGEGRGLDAEGFSLDFPKLSVKVRPELVTFGEGAAVTVTEDGVQGGGIRVDARGLDALKEQKAAEGRELVFFDGRNAFEAELGRFRGAVVPPVQYTREFLSELDSGRYDHLKDQPVVTYCTGGIRCEVLSALMLQRGFREVYQLDGGIVRYLQEKHDRGDWEGELYVFDGRVGVTARDGEPLAADPWPGDHRGLEG